MAGEHGVGVLILSEQYKNKEAATWYSDILGTAAIWIVDTNSVVVTEHGQGRGFVWVKHRELTIFSCYFTPNEPAQIFREKLQELEDAVRNTNGSVIVAGDFNARSREWGVHNTDSRGRRLLEMAARLGLVVLNDGTTTFRRPGYTQTTPDITLASEILAPRVRSWAVLEGYSGSDHQYITFEVRSTRERMPHIDAPLRRWNVGRMNRDRFSETLARETQTIERATDMASTESYITAVMRAISVSCEASIPQSRPRNGKPPVYWWTTEIAETRRKCHRLRRKAQRSRGRSEVDRNTEEYKAARKELRRMIRSSKVRCWNELTDDVNRNPWGLGYKVVMRKLGTYKTSGAMDASIIDNIVRELFPTHPRRSNVEYHVEQVPPITAEELENSVSAMREKKAPGPDGIPNEILKIVHQTDPQILLGMYNACLLYGVFSTQWKVARLVLISKGKGNPALPSSYRPLCMLNTAGKLLEVLLRTRLRAAISAAGDLSPMQYGFRKGRSTVNAISQVVNAVQLAENRNHHSRRIVLLVTLDVKNAFNTARWVDILRALDETFRIPKYLLRIIDDYLKDRALMYETSDGWKKIRVTSGAAQGSILGPDLWNVTYDSLLRTEMPDESFLVGYADDVAAVVSARNVNQAEIKLDRIMRSVLAWMTKHGLTLALNKTEIVVLTKKRISTPIPIRIVQEVIPSKPAVKYLGIMIDKNISFARQIQCTVEKAERSTAALSRLMINVGGPTYNKRRILMNAVDSVLLYGSEVWADALYKQVNCKKLSRIQRRMALRVASAYRTVSTPAVFVIAGAIPVEMIARERKAIYLRRSEEDRKAVKQEERQKTLENWQRTWEQETKGRWTARMITNLNLWVNRKHGEIDFYMTQFLSGHGYYKAYLKKMGITDSPECLYCTEVEDDAEHTFFDCQRWRTQRERLMSQVGEIRPETILEVLLRNSQSWEKVRNFIKTVLVNKKLELDRQQRSDQ